MKQHRAFAEAVILSTYFDPNGGENLNAVLKRFNDPLNYQVVVKHCQRHMKPKIQRWRALNGLVEKSAAMKKKDRVKELIVGTMDVVEAPVSTGGEHEQTLDEFIAKGRKNLDGITVTATTLIQAIKAKAEIENKTKDRRFDAMKSLFTGMGPQEEQDEAPALQDLP